MTSSLPKNHLLTTAQTAERLNVSESTLRYWRHRREGPPCVKLGALVRYDTQKLEQWLKAQQEATDREYA